MEPSAPRYQPYLDTRPAPFRWRLGLRPLDLDAWIEIDDRFELDLAEKRRVLSEHHETAFVALDDVAAECREVLDAVVVHLRRLDPARFGGVVPEPGLHPLDAAGRLVQEDLVVLVERDGELICGAGSVCFPNRWDLRSKLGRPLHEIHAPVARLNAQLRDPIDRALARLTPDRAFWRLGWGVIDTDLRYQAVDGTAPPRPAAAPPSSHHLRVERETLRRFPVTGCVLFTIRTYLTPLGEVPVGAGAEALADAVEALPPDVASYKQLDVTGRAIAAWLRQLATTSTQ